MTLGNLPDNKLFSLAMHGYNSYQIECGILCGGYQGPLYPNPTTLAYPGFNPYLYTDPKMSTYTPDVSYTGLDPGDPGIDYKNPGHLLGLMDTFGRMSYGIGQMLSVYNGTEDVVPAVSISVPIIGLDENNALDMDDIYPALAEIPTDWINSFTIAEDGKVSPDPRYFVQWPSPGGGHTPSLTPLTADILNGLFGNGKTILSYYGMPQYFRQVIEALWTAAEPLAEKAELEFTLDNPAAFNEYSYVPIFEDIEDLEHEALRSQGLAVNQCKVLTPTEALKVLTGSDDYHNGSEDMNEYRSLTELNSVINLVPLQMIGGTYWLEANGAYYEAGGGGGGSWENDEYSGWMVTVCSYMIADLNINISDIPIDPNEPEPGVVTVEGEVTIDPLITNPDAMDWYVYHRPRPPGSYDPYVDSPSYTDTFHDEWIKRRIDMRMDMTNKYGWDKTWLGGDETSDVAAYNDNVEETCLCTDADGGELTIADTTPANVSFSKTFTLGAGCSTIRMRILCRNYHRLNTGNGWPVVSPSHWVPYSYEQIIYDFFGNVIDVKTVYPTVSPGYPFAGIFDSNWAGDGTQAVIDGLNMSNINVSFTVAGTRFDPIPFEVSL